VMWSGRYSYTMPHNFKVSMLEIWVGVFFFSLVHFGISASFHLVLWGPVKTYNFVIRLVWFHFFFICCILLLVLTSNVFFIHHQRNTLYLYRITTCFNLTGSSSGVICS
jgi:hypothetical protein